MKVTEKVGSNPALEGAEGVSRHCWAVLYAGQSSLQPFLGSRPYG